MPWATVWSNVYLPLRLEGIGKADAGPRVAAALRWSGLAAPSAPIRASFPAA